MMRQMRENTKWIMILSSAAFVGLMVFSWGMDITGRSTGSPGEIGRVNGTPVPYDEYNATYRNLYDQAAAAQQQPITSQQNRDIEQRAWDQMVDRILLQQELKRRGIEVTDEEIRQAARFQPPPELRSAPMFQTDGNFDLVKYQNFLTNSADATMFAQLEGYYREVLPQGKLMRQIGTGVFLTDAELWQRFRDTHETAWIRFVALNPAQRIPDDSVTVSSAEIESYWKEHQKDFEVPSRASVKVVSLSKTPTPADTAAMRDRAAALVAELRGGAVIDSVGKREAEAEIPARFEDLGTFGRGAMVEAFDTAAFDAPVGRATGPIQTNFGFHVLLVSKRTADSVTAKHILVPITRTVESENALLALADSMEALAESRKLEEVASLLGLAVNSAEVNDAVPFIPGIGAAGDASDWAFAQDAKPGDVSEVFENDQTFYVAELISKKAGGVMTLEEATPTIQTVLRLEKKIEKATEQAKAMADRIAGGTSMTDAAAPAGLEVRTPEPFTRTDFIPLLGQRNAAIGAAFGLETGKVAPVATSDDVYVIEKLGATPADSTQWVSQKEEQRRALVAILQQQRLQEWVAALRKSAEIVDRRAEVLRPVSDTTAVAGGPVNRLGY